VRESYYAARSSQWGLRSRDESIYGS